MFLDIDGKDPSRIAFNDDAGIEVSYGDLAGYCGELKELGLPRAVAFCLCENNSGCASAVIGCQEAGIVPVLFGSRADRNILRELGEVYTPAYFIVPDHMVEQFEGEQVFSKYGYTFLRTENEPYPINDKLSLLLTTSGSTGSPKCVRYKYGNLDSNARNAAKAFGFTEDDIGMCDLPIQYTMGLNVILSHIAVGGRAYLTMYNLMSPDFYRVLKEERCTNFCGVPFSYKCMMRLRFFNMDLPDLRILAQGGGKLTEKRFIELGEYAKRTGKRFCATFGTTETSARMAYLPPECALERVGSIGKAIPGGTLFLIDDEGKALPEGEAEGELAYRGPGVTMGYAYTKEDLLLDDVFNGEYRTGDLARRDADGFYYITGRRSRFLKLFGTRVSMDHCEGVIKDEFHTDCACSGTDKCMEIYVTGDVKPEDVVSYIAGRTGITRGAFRAYNIEEIPRSDSGKVRYKELSPR